MNVDVSRGGTPAGRRNAVWCALAALAASVPFCTFAQESAAPGPVDAGDGQVPWTSLFNGRDLSGWHVACVPADREKAFWRVEDGWIVCDSMGHSGHDYVWLMTDGEYDDFELKVTVRSWRDSTGNSGIQVRSRYDEAEGWLNGPQVDIHPRGPWRNGFIYDETRGVQVWLWPDVGRPRNARPEHAPEGWTWRHADEGDGWNEVYIRCEGTRILTRVNGVVVADYDGAGILDDETHRRHNVGMNGHIALQLHRGDALRIAFKDIRVRRLERE